MRTRSPRSRTRIVVAASVVLVALTTSCGSSRPALTASASQQLSDEVQAARAATTTGDVAAAEGQLAQLRHTVEALQQQHQISTARTASVLSAAGAVQLQLATITTTTTSTTLSTAPFPNQAPHPGKKHDGGQQGATSSEGGD